MGDSLQCKVYTQKGRKAERSIPKSENEKEMMGSGRGRKSTIFVVLQYMKNVSNKNIDKHKGNKETKFTTIEC